VQPEGIIFPVGDGIGATQLGWLVISPTRAAGMPPMITEVEAFAIMPGPAGTQPAKMQGAVISVDRAAGCPPIKTLVCPLTICSGIAGCGAGAGVGPGG
jgi:hypothetical protein